MSRQESARPIGLIGRVRASYWDFRGAAERLIAERPSEGVLLSFLMIAMLILSFGGVIELTASQDPKNPPPPEKLQSDLMGVLITRFFIGSLAVYFFAAAATLIARAFGGRGGYYETRVAVIWAVLVSAPVVLLQNIVSAVGRLMTRSTPEDAMAMAETIAFFIQTGLFAVAVAIMAGCLAGAHRFSSTSRVLGVFLLIIATLAIVAFGVSRLL